MNAPATPSSAPHDDTDAYSALRAIAARRAAVAPALADLAARSAETALLDLTPRLALYDASFVELERAMWSGGGDFHALLADYQALFREYERLIAATGRDPRHDFIIAIPVADRPAHLATCLESIYQLCRLYDYGGHQSGGWTKVRVIVSEDSRDAAHVRKHLELVADYRARGVDVVYYGLDEQYERLHALPTALRESLGRLLTTQPRDHFYLKGQAANRNLAYLKFLDLTRDAAKTLYYLVDSDQSFCVNRRTADGDEAVYALNYFRSVDRIFSSTPVCLLTGKMVGDPPVSPSVMAANFVDDVYAFFSELAAHDGDAPCRFHSDHIARVADAAYHDMAGLFGFKHDVDAYPYRCRIEGAHDHIACLDDFSARLNAFFYGEHLTRKTVFEYGQGFSALAPARTVYPGNYVANFEGLRYVIPFGHLRLRMSGPTAGRLIAAEIGNRFASCNLPNLHQRTTGSGPDKGFRPGVEQLLDGIDLSSEFERQFFGDLMLFTTEALVEQADVTETFDRDVIEPILAAREKELLELYARKHAALVGKSRALARLVFESHHWWLGAPRCASALERVRRFLANIERNFGEQAVAWQQIHSMEHRETRKRQIVDALMGYRTERNAWERLLEVPLQTAPTD